MRNLTGSRLALIAARSRRGHITDSLAAIGTLMAAGLLAVSLLASILAP